MAELSEREWERLDAIPVALWQCETERGYEHTAAKTRAAVEAILTERLAGVWALADEWEATVYKLPPGYPMTVNEFCRIWFKAPLRAALTAATETPASGTAGSGVGDE